MRSSPIDFGLIDRAAIDGFGNFLVESRCDHSSNFENGARCSSLSSRNKEYIFLEFFFNDCVKHGQIAWSRVLEPLVILPKSEANLGVFS